MVRVLGADRLAEPFVASLRYEERRGLVGVFFDVDGGLGGMLAIMVPGATRDRLLEHLVGKRCRDIPEHVAGSALREFGNILVSHVVSAMADTLGVAVVPSVPHLVTDDAPAALARLLALRESDRPTLRVETEISDRLGEVRALLVFVPDRASVISSSRRI
jgi:chemotaxis protein CheY-P-specific phosphatase CheC